ncbi:MAG TPA: hypothetical protein K8U70_03605 [Facklamia tabacinasalis]|nr:hypothetical protein [Ruoffia tabacinasalis]
MKFKEMIVDLTPLLDVILILLFMVLATQSQSTTETITALEEEVSQLAQTQMPQTQSEQTWYQTYQQSIGKVNIVFPSSLDDDPMYLVLEDGTEVQKPETQDLYSWLSSQVETIEQEVIIVSFTYNNEEIFLRDYRNILSAITQIDQNSDSTVVYQEQLIELSNENE